MGGEKKKKVSEECIYSKYSSHEHVGLGVNSDSVITVGKKIKIKKIKWTEIITPYPAHELFIKRLIDAAGS